MIEARGKFNIVVYANYPMLSNYTFLIDIEKMWRISFLMCILHTVFLIFTDIEELIFMLSDSPVSLTIIFII